MVLSLGTERGVGRGGLEILDLREPFRSIRQPPEVDASGSGYPEDVDNQHFLELLHSAAFRQHVRSVDMNCLDELQLRRLLHAGFPEC